MENSTVSRQHNALASPVIAPGRVVACLDRSRLSQQVAQHALAIAGALSVPVTLLQVLEAGPAGATRADPLEWDIRRHEARSTIEPLVASLSNDKGSVDAEIVEGHAAEQICLWAADRAAELIVLGAHGEGRLTDDGLGNTARNVLDRATGSVLLVPALGVSGTTGREMRYRRLMVPVDGSSRAESVIPYAVRLAQAVQAELLIAYVIPVPEMIESGPLEAEDIELRECVVRRNERVAKDYLDRLRGRIACVGLRVRTMVLRDDDVRSRLSRLITDEKVDLVILSAHGQSGRTDAPYGSVTAHLIGHSSVPLLIVRDRLTVAAQLGDIPNFAGAKLANMYVQ
ncbi:MAG: universal stress protein [Alphaproteobacteria bacterium]|nr:universal stress protein [Alphaproteobacteria bacterium]